jgi:hypothetical protein
MEPTVQVLSRFHHVSFLNQRSRSYCNFATSRTFVMPDQWSTISMILRSRSSRDLAYREFPHHTLLTPPMCKSTKIPITCHVSFDSNSQVFYRDFAYHEFEPLSFGFPDLRNSKMKPLSYFDCFPPSEITLLILPLSLRY